LGARRRKPLKLNPFRATKRIEQFFRIAIQARFVRNVNRERPAGRGLIRYVLLFGIVGHEPFEVPERNPFSVRQNIRQLFEVSRVIKETRERIKKQVGLGHLWTSSSSF
jgi:hypothetical protein